MVCFKARWHFQKSVSFFWVRPTSYCGFIFYLFGKIWKMFDQLCILRCSPAVRHGKHGIYFKEYFFWHFQTLFCIEKWLSRKNWMSLWLRAIHAVSKPSLLYIDRQYLAWMVAGMPKSIFWKQILQFLHFGMPVAIHSF